MPKKINNIPQSKIETKQEQHWFSYIKFKAQELDFGGLELKITVKDGKIKNIRNTKIEENFGIK